MPAEQVAAAIAKALSEKLALRYLSTGSDVRMYNMLGFMQCWLCPSKISNLLREKFGLKALEKKMKAAVKQ